MAKASPGSVKGSSVRKEEQKRKAIKAAREHGQHNAERLQLKTERRRGRKPRGFMLNESYMDIPRIAPLKVIRNGEMDYVLEYLKAAPDYRAGHNCAYAVLQA
jgi:hypothetical protein